MFSISQIFRQSSVYWQSSEFFKGGASVGDFIGGALIQQLFTSIYSSDEKQQQQIPEIFEILEIQPQKTLRTWISCHVRNQN